MVLRGYVNIAKFRRNLKRISAVFIVALVTLHKDFTFKKLDIHHVLNDLGFSLVLRKYNEFLLDTAGKGYFRFGISSQNMVSEQFSLIPVFELSQP